MKVVVQLLLAVGLSAQVPLPGIIAGGGGGGGGGGGADVALDNLAAVNINTSLLAQSGVDVGNAAKPFRNLYIFGSGTYGTTSFLFTGTPTAARTWTIPDVSGTFARTDAAQTFTGIQTFSSQIAGGISGFAAGNWPIFTQSFYNDAATTIPHGATRYVYPGSGPFDAFSGSTVVQRMYFTENRTFRKLCVTTFLAQSVNGTLVATVVKNDVDTAMVITIAAGAPASGTGSTGPYCDATDQVSFVSGDYAYVRWVNNANTGAGDDALLLQQTIQYQE